MKKSLLKKAVLIYPKFSGETFWSLRKSIEMYVPKNKFGLPRAQSPPLGLLSICGVLKKYYNVILLDRNVDPRASSLKKLISDENVCFVATGGMIGQEEDALHIAKVTKEFGKPFVIGGPFVDKKILGKSPLNGMDVIAVEGEAELVIEDILKDLLNKNFGTYYEGKHCLAKEFLVPDFSFINPNDYMSMAVQFSRGCPFSCEFCDITLRFGKGPRYIPEKKINEQFKQLYKLGWRGPIFIVDDNLTAYPSKAIETLKSVQKIEKELNHQFPKTTQVSLELSDDQMKELRNLLRETNFNMLFIGVETNNLESLKETKKNQNLRGEKTLKEKISLISRETKAGVMIGIIFGFDHDTLDSGGSLIEFCNSLPCATIMAGNMKIVPKTPLWERLVKEDRLNVSNFGSGNNSDGVFNFIPYNFSVEEGEKKFVEIQKGIYNEKAYFNRLMGQLKISGPSMAIPKVSIKESIYSIFKIFTKENARMYRKYLPTAIKIAYNRFGVKGITKMGHVIGIYLAMCSRYAHSEFMVHYLEEQVSKRKYEDWQKHSWKEMQERKGLLDN